MLYIVTAISVCFIIATIALAKRNESLTASLDHAVAQKEAIDATLRTWKSLYNRLEAHNTKAHELLHRWQALTDAYKAKHRAIRDEYYALTDTLGIERTKRLIYAHSVWETDLQCFNPQEGNDLWWDREHLNLCDVCQHQEHMACTNCGEPITRCGDCIQNRGHLCQNCINDAKLTCSDCTDTECQYRNDPFNTDGDCLAMK